MFAKTKGGRPLINQRDYLVVDSTENDKVRCETDKGLSVIIEIKDLPSEVKVGDWIYKDNDKYIIDEEKTKERKNGNIDLFKKLKGE